jgi:hypothetical protein
VEGISDIRIVGIDSKRPPIIRKEPYIDVYFALSHKAPKNWCEDFNSLLAKQKFSATIRVDEGLYVETWVKSPDDIPANLELLKAKIAECNEQYIAKIAYSKGLRDAENSALGQEQGEQGRLNTILAGLDFDT